jgi:NAD(P)-dependent dehydrogenase (short-subunit alcohol dehydrogenase family)
MKRVLVIGGASGIGLSLSLYLANQDEIEHVYVLDKKPFDEQYKLDKISAEVFDVTSEDYSLLDNYADVDALYITAGYGHLGMVEDFDDKYIRSIFAVNAEGPIRILRHFYPRMLEPKQFYCAVMVSIAAHLSSPLFAYYSATKAAVRMFIEAANVELEVQGSENRIMEVSPGSLKGTSFNGGQSDPAQNTALAGEIVDRSVQRQQLFIPQYDEVFKGVLQRYQDNPHQYGISSYWYKKNGRQHVKK